MNNDKKARLLTILLYAYNDMNKKVGVHESELENTILELDSVMSPMSDMLRVDKDDVLYALLNKFSGVDSFHENPSEEMLTSENYKMINTLLETCIELATDLKNEIEKVEK